MNTAGSGEPAVLADAISADSPIEPFSLHIHKVYVTVIPWLVRMSMEIIHELKRVGYLTYRWTNREPAVFANAISADSPIEPFSSHIHKVYVIFIPWLVHMYLEIIHELQRVGYLTYRWTNMV